MWLGIGFLFAGAATINTLMAGVPRILYGMAVDGALPKVFTYLHPRFKTPLLCILVAMLIPCLHALWLGGNPDNIMHLVLAAVCAWSFAYLLVTVSVISLRIRRLICRGPIARRGSRCHRSCPVSALCWACGSSPRPA